jgi:hypothetical protein
MEPRYRAILLAGGLLISFLPLAAPVRAENPMTPLRATEPATGAPRPDQPTAAAKFAAPSAAAASNPAASPAIAADPAGTADDATAAGPGRRASRHSRKAAAAPVKPGRWEFTAQLRTPAPASAAATQPPAVAAPPGGGGMATSYTSCLESDNAVPADVGPQCRLDRHDRRGSRIAWSMTCADTGVRADGVAQYRGDTMAATVVSHIPGTAGRVTDMTQHLTGRYLGPCPATAAAPPPTGALPPGPPPAAEAAGGVQPAPPSPETPPAADATEPPARSLASPGRPRHGRHAHRWRRHHHTRGTAYGASYGRSSSFGPAANSGGGP